MLTRRRFGSRLAFLPAAASFTEAAFAQRAAVAGPFPPDTVWLNANENPDGPPEESIQAMSAALAQAGRYCFQELISLRAAISRSESLEPQQIVVGAGSSEVLIAATLAFTSADRPLVTSSPTFELPTTVTEAVGREAVRVPLTEDLRTDVKKLVEEAARVRGGMIYVCNPNNPTSTINTKAEIAWLIENLPAGAVAVIDEAYSHFSESAEMASAVAQITTGRDVVITRTFSKIYGMAGMRVGYACARPELISRMNAYRNNVISVVSARGALAAIENSARILTDRRRRYLTLRKELCEWLREHGITYVEPHANFVMIDVRRDVREVGRELLARGVAAGRPFPPLTNMLRVSLGAPADMDKFRSALQEVLSL